MKTNKRLQVLIWAIAFGILIARGYAGTSAVMATAQKSLEQIKAELVSLWLVTVEGDPRTRTFEIQDVTTKGEVEFVLTANYGWSYDARKSVKAKATVSTEGLKIDLTTPAHGLIVANQTENGSFIGTLTDKNGKVSGVKLEKQPNLKAQEGVEVIPRKEPDGDSNKPPGVLFLHGWNHSPDTWRDFSMKAKKQGYITSVPQLPKSKLPDMLEEVNKHLEVLKNQGANPGRIALVGESTGANLALWYAAMNSSVKTVILLSPGFRYMIPLDSRAIKSYGDRPILIVASKSDDENRKSLANSEELMKLATGRKELKVASVGHGVDITDSNLVDWVMSWLKESL